MGEMRCCQHRVMPTSQLTELRTNVICSTGILLPVSLTRSAETEKMRAAARTQSVPEDHRYLQAASKYAT
jgi:hypothetical protein